MKSVIDLCMDNVAYQRYYDRLGTTNSACIEAIKYLMPIVIDKELKGDQKRCMKMHYFEHMTQQEIAIQLGVTQPTVSRKLKTAREAVKKYLEYSLLAANKTSALLH